MRGPKLRRTLRARQLRASATEAEKRLWTHLCNRQLAGCKFNRQVAVGPYFADFACRERKLIVELDGGQHAHSASDLVRTRYLHARGYRVIRFWNSEMFESIDSVLTRIFAAIESA